jgi:hypothetical protein
VLGKGRPSLALLNGMRPDLWPFPRHSLPLRVASRAACNFIRLNQDNAADLAATFASYASTGTYS